MIKKLIHKLIVVAFLFVIAAIWWFGLYPVATADFNPVFKRDFDQKFEMAKYYAKSSAKKNNLEPLSDEQVEMEVLNSMVHEKVLREAAKKDLAAQFSEMKKVAKDRVSESVNSSEKYQTVVETSKILFGTDSIKKVSDYFLEPVAFIDEVKARVADSGMDFSRWYKDNATRVRVYVFLPGYTWNNENMRIIRTEPSNE